MRIDLCRIPGEVKILCMYLTLNSQVNKSSDFKNNAPPCPTRGAPKLEQIPYQLPVYSPGGGGWGLQLIGA